MKKRAENESDMSSRRNFLKKVGAGVGAISVSGNCRSCSHERQLRKRNPVKMVKLLSPDGTLVEVDQDDIRPAKGARC